MKHQFKFSIIMSVYKVEEYLEEAVDSILNQDIGFKDNIQLILVNDGSPDNSEAICLRYKDMYPDNVVYVKKENGGLADARNVGLEYVEGEIVNFCDPDDILEKNVCSLVYKFFEKHQDVNLASIRIKLFEAQTGFRHPLNYKFSQTRVIDIFEEPNCVQLSPATSFIKKMYLQVCLMAGACYYLTLLGITALFFGGQYQGVGVSGIIIMITSLVMAIIPRKNGSPFKARKKAYR